MNFVAEAEVVAEALWLASSLPTLCASLLGALAFGLSRSLHASMGNYSNNIDTHTH